MKDSSALKKTCLNTCGAGLLLLLTSAPVLYLTFTSAAAAISGKITFSQTASFSLLARSILLCLSAAGLCALLGFFVAFSVWMFFEKHAVKMAVGLLLLILLPPFVHTQAWIFFIDKLNTLLGSLLGIKNNFSGIPAVLFTTAFSYLPLSSVLSLSALLGVPPEFSDQCQVDGTEMRAFFKLYLPLLRTSFFIGGILVFLLSINDYGIPSVFGVNVYALELFARFSAGGSIQSVFYQSLPLTLVSILSFLLFARLQRQSSFSFSSLQGKNVFQKETAQKIPAAVGVIIFLLYALVPLLSLFTEALRAESIFSILSDASRELFYSVGVSTFASIICLIPATLGAYLFSRFQSPLWLLALLALPFIIPAPITGLSLIGLWNTPFLRFLYQSPLMPAIGLIARFAFIQILILSVALSRLDKEYIENLRIYHPGILPSAYCLLRLLWREALCSVLVVFALGMGEFGVSLLITPPGYQMLSIKIYNYLHYGASEVVASLCLFMLLTILTVSAAVFLLLSGVRHEK